MAQLLKHYWVDRDNLNVFAVSPAIWTRPMFGYVAPNIEGLQIIHRLEDDNNIPFCLSTCPDETTVTEKEGLEIITQEEWDAIVDAYDAKREAQRYAVVRELRDQLLAETDWIVIKSLETGVALSSEFSTWREALRDLPNGDTFPIDLPAAPVTVSVTNEEYQGRIRSISMINDPLPPAPEPEELLG
jgi:hypothetical protein